MDLQSAVAVSVLPGISRLRAAAVYKALRAAEPGVTLEIVIEICAPAADSACIAATAREDAARLLDAARAGGIAAIALDDERYPPLLRTIADPPPALWVRGDPSVLTRPAVAIVGSRAATSYAREVAARLGGELAARQMLVVSGLARGADGAAHRGCLAAGGTTVGVLGCGPDIIYPSEHRDLAASVCASGALVSELGPGAPPLPEHFPLRNRLISGISLAVVVVEANEKSGSLITARYALEHGRDVMAVPGSVLGGRNRGSHGLLKDGAKVVESADDILEELGWPALRSGNASLEGPALRSGNGSLEGPALRAAPDMSSNSQRPDPLLANLIPGDTYDLDELSATLGLSGSRLLPRLTEWEMRGHLVRLAGGRYAVAGRK
jgi:DNA processing protein